MTNPSPWYAIRRRAAVAASAVGALASAEILIYGDIGESWYEDTVSARTFVAELDALDVDAITVRINSIGGSVPDGLAIYNAMRRHKATITTEVDGWACSIASLIAMAGDKVRMAANSVLMVHGPWTGIAGNATQLREMADELDTWAQAMSASYAARTGDQSGMLALLTDGKDHFYTADEALAAKFVDEISDAHPVAASAARDFPLSRFRSPPSYLHAQLNMPTPNTTVAPDAAAILAQDRTRREGIRASLTPMLRFSGVEALMRQCEDDPTCTVEAAGHRTLQLIGSTATPVAAGWSPSISTGDDRQMTEFLAAASDLLLQRGGVKVAEPHPAARDLARMNVSALCERVLSMRGVNVRDQSKVGIITAAMSTSDFPQLLGNTAGRALRLGYTEAEVTFGAWTGEREVPDFREQTLLNLSEAPGLEKVNELAEYKHGSMSESAAGFRAETYGKILRISRQMLINDDLGAFTQIPQAFGASARRLEADHVYALLTTNPVMADGVALFHADHGNLAAGASPSLTSLDAARVLMRSQRGIGGKAYLDVRPRYVICPVGLEGTFEQLIYSKVDPSKTNDTPNLDFIRRLIIVADPRLTGNAWYLAADPRQIEGVIRAYVAGTQRPELIEDNEFGVDAISYKARIDFCAGVVDHRAMVKNPGA